jgi:RNA polymerase sigma factor (sigma-70 family)
MAAGKLGVLFDHPKRTALPQDGGSTDGQLLERFLSHRDEDAFAELVRRHGPMVWAACRRGLGRVQDAEDAFQATFLVLVRKAASIRHRDPLGGWLHGVACRAVLETQAAAHRSREQHVHDLPEPPAREGTSMADDLRPVLDQELHRLPDKYRVPVVLCCLEGRSRKEAAHQLGIPEGTLSSRLATARQRLARRLGRRGLSLPAGALTAVLAPDALPAAVPATLTAATVKLARAAADRVTVAGAGQVVALAERIGHAMRLSKYKGPAAMLLAATLVLGVGWLLLPAATQQPAPPTPGKLPPAQVEGAGASKTGGIEPATVAAWEQAGAHFGWLEWHDRCFLQFSFDRPQDREALPCFALTTWPQDGVKALPAPAVPFAISLQGCKLRGHEIKALAGLQQLQALNLGMTQSSEGGLRGLAALKGLKRLGLNGPYVTEEMVSDLAGLPQLETLNLQGSCVSAAALKGLAEITTLRELNVGFTAAPGKDPYVSPLVTDTGVKELARLQHLHKLVLSGTAVTPAGVKELAALKQLRALYLDSTKVGDRGLKALGGFSQLQLLDLGTAKITDAGLKELTGLGQLKSLNLSCIRIVGGGLKELVKLEQLQTLRLASATDVTDADLRAVAGLRELRELDLSNNWIRMTDAGMKELVVLGRLEKLDLNATLVGDTGLKALAGLKELRELTLSAHVTDAGLKELAGFQKLQKLSFHGGRSFKITDAGLKELAALADLQALSLSETEVTGAGLKDLAGLPKLKTLNLTMTKASDAGMKGVAKLPHLQKLDVAQTALADAGLAELAALPQLQTLNISYTQVTDAGLLRLKEFPRLRQLMVAVVGESPERLGPPKVTAAGVAALRQALPKLMVGY